MLVLSHIQDDELNQAFGIHQQSHLQSFLQRHLTAHCRQHAPADLRESSHHHHGHQFHRRHPIRDGLHVRPQPADGEEQRQEQHIDEVLNLLNHRLAHRPIGHRQPEHERPEYRVCADHVRHEPRDQDSHEDAARVQLVHLLPVWRVPRHPPDGRPDDQEAQENEHCAGEHRPQRLQHVASATVQHRQGDREKDPRDGVIDQCGGDGEVANVGVEEFELGEDAGEDGEGSDGEGYTDEDDEASTGCVGVAGAFEAEGAYDAEGERDHAAGGEDDGLAAGAGDDVELELDANSEDEVDEAEIGNSLQYENATQREHVH